MIISILFIMEKMIMSMSNSNFLIFWGDSVVPERNLPEKGHFGIGRCPGSLERTLKNFG